MNEFLVNEFELIARYFTRPPLQASFARQAVGDDCALIDLGSHNDQLLAVTTDMLLEGRHFFSSVDPAALGHKALAVNLSDLAAAGARPRCFFLSLALPRADESWLAAFSAGLFALADAQRCDLLGGDTTRTPRIETRSGPLTISITAIGDVPRAQTVTRAGARVGDDIWVSGKLGDAALALLAVLEPDVLPAPLDFADAATCTARLERPEPRIALGLALRGLASAAMDLSDGLLGDLAHILKRSQVAAQLQWPAIPRSPALLRQPEAVQLRCALAGGDDYELLFTSAADKRGAVERAAQRAGVAVTRIGSVVPASSAAVPLLLLDQRGQPIDTAGLRAYDHFAG